jgi:hypothetical protein
VPGASAGDGSMCRSDPQMPQKATSTTTSPAAGSGSGSSPSASPRSSVIWTTLTPGRTLTTGR